MNECTPPYDLAKYAEEVHLVITHKPLLIMVPLVKVPQQAELYSQALTAAWFTT